MVKQYIVALSNIVPFGEDAKFRDWYINVHFPQVAQVAGVIECRLFVSSTEQLAGGTPAFSYVALYLADDVLDATLKLRAAAAANLLDMTPLLDFKSAITLSVEEIACRVSAEAEIGPPSIVRTTN